MSIARVIFFKIILVLGLFLSAEGVQRSASCIDSLAKWSSQEWAKKNNIEKANQCIKDVNRYIKTCPIKLGGEVKGSKRPSSLIYGVAGTWYDKDMDKCKKMKNFKLLFQETCSHQ